MIAFLPSTALARGRGWWVLVSPEASVIQDSCQNLCSLEMFLGIQWCPGRQSSRHEVSTGSSACHAPAESTKMAVWQCESTCAEITTVSHWRGKSINKFTIFQILFSWERDKNTRGWHGKVSFPGGTSSLWHYFHQGQLPKPHPHLAVSDQPLLLPN